MAGFGSVCAELVAAQTSRVEQPIIDLLMATLTKIERYSRNLLRREQAEFSAYMVMSPDESSVNCAS